MMKLSLLILVFASVLLLPACRHELPDGLPQEYMDELIQMAENGAQHCLRLMDDSNPDHCHSIFDEKGNQGPKSSSILVPGAPFHGSKALVRLMVGCAYPEKPGEEEKVCNSPVYGSDPWERRDRRPCDTELTPFRTWPKGKTDQLEPTELIYVTKNRDCPYLKVETFVRRKGPNGTLISADAVFDQNILLAEKAARGTKR